MVMLSVKIFVFIVMLVHYSLQVFKYGPKIVLLTAQVSVETPSWPEPQRRDRKSTRLNSSHGYISYAVFCLKKKTRSIESDVATGEIPAPRFEQAQRRSAEPTPSRPGSRAPSASPLACSMFAHTASLTYVC